MVIFPQGTRVSKTHKKEAQPGIGFIVAKTSLPILPVYIKGSDIVMPPGAKRPKRHPIRVIFGKLQHYSKTLPYQEIADQIMVSIHSLA